MSSDLERAWKNREDELRRQCNTETQRERQRADKLALRLVTLEDHLSKAVADGVYWMERYHNLRDTLESEMASTTSLELQAAKIGEVLKRAKRGDVQSSDQNIGEDYCKCRHARSRHAPILSHNYTQGKCIDCECQHFIIRKVQP